MKIKHEVWTIKKLIGFRDSINPKPQYQRTAVWGLPKKRLLIDSILRGYDLPKFYLTRSPNDPKYDYEVTDGQQRMRSIWEFSSDVKEENFSLTDFENDGIDLKHIDYKALITNHKKIARAFLDYKIQVTLILDSSPEEIRTVFARLQMGERLIPVELRHATASNLGAQIVGLVETNEFFKESRIPNKRFKHQDYLDHVFAVAYYDASSNIKAPDLKQMYLELASCVITDLQPMLRDIKKTLDYMRGINKQKPGLFKNKWGFVDVFNLIYRNLSNIKEVKPKNLAHNFQEFEKARKKHNRQPERLIEDKTSIKYDKDLYDYILAFKSGGAEKNNYQIRYRVLFNKLLNKENFALI